MRPGMKSQDIAPAHEFYFKNWSLMITGSQKCLWIALCRGNERRTLAEAVAERLNGQHVSRKGAYLDHLLVLHLTPSLHWCPPWRCLNTGNVKEWLKLQRVPIPLPDSKTSSCLVQFNNWIQRDRLPFCRYRGGMLPEIPSNSLVTVTLVSNVDLCYCVKEKGMGHIQKIYRI